MSTYGTKVAVDVAAQHVDTVATALADGFPTVAPLPDGHRVRVTAGLADVGLIPRISALLAAVCPARAAVAEDNDEHGACWVVLAAADGLTYTVHRRYVLNADPEDPDDVAAALSDLAPQQDPRAQDVGGREAAVAAAHLFDADPAAMAAAEAGSGTAYRELGVVGGPFPWWSALGLAWDPPAAGTPSA